MLKAWEGVGVVSTTSELVGTLRGSVRYIRGSHLREPQIEIVPERNVIAAGERVKVNVTIRNRGTLLLNGGQVVLDTGPLRPVLFPLGGAVLNYGTIPPNVSRTVSFELEAFSEGRVPIEMRVEGGWDSPVPRERRYTRAISLAGGIRVGPPGVDLVATLESPQLGSFESGIGLIRGWVCEAEMVEVQIDDGPRMPVAHGTSREDTAAVCGRADTGFGLTVNWNLFGDGAHTLRAFADGEEFGQATFNVTTLGEDFLRDVSGEYEVSNFPASGRNIRLRWSQPHQNFVISDAGQSSSVLSPLQAGSSSPATLESPQLGSFESGIGLIRGWVCEAEVVEVQIDDGPRMPVAHGTSREDTAAVCGRADTGFGLTVNWNLFGDGAHTLRAFADGEEFGQATFNVTTLGEDFLRDVSGEYEVSNFPASGRNIRLRWSQPHQNFVISDAQ